MDAHLAQSSFQFHLERAERLCPFEGARLCLAVDGIGNNKIRCSVDLGGRGILQVLLHLVFIFSTVITILPAVDIQSINGVSDAAETAIGKRSLVFNIAVDLLIGTVPVIGDVIDFAWKSNTKNLRLLNKYAKGKGGSVWSDWLWVFILFGLLLLFGLGLLGLAIYAIRQTGLGA